MNRLMKQVRQMLSAALRSRTTMAAVIMGLLVSGSFFCEPAAARTQGPEAEKLVQLTNEGEDPDEGEKIESALVEQGYFRDDIPLTYENQDYLHTACEEFGVDYNLALAVIRQETNFRNVVGSDDQSIGYMQIQARWHRDRMEKLDVSDLTNPYGNFRVGCSFLGELLESYDDDLNDALSYYHSGQPGVSAYSRSVIDFMREIRDH